ncbi:MAG: ECF-type sigma factor [Gemmatimonadetes bacterium]|nr:ECF-type sigma factor [Gemmatimonadota bacterium]
MQQPQDPPITELLAAARNGDENALAQVFGRVYEELRGLAHLVREGRAGDTLNTTALVHEAYIKLAGTSAIALENRAHFFAVAGRAMRQIVVDAARRRMAARRGGGAIAITYDDDAHASPLRPARLIALDDALERLASFDPRRAQVVEHRIFAGLSVAQSAELLGISTGTVERDWRAARAWLALEISDETGPVNRDAAEGPS